MLGDKFTWSYKEGSQEGLHNKVGDYRTDHFTVTLVFVHETQ